MNRDTALSRLRIAKQSLAADPGMYARLGSLLDAPNVDWNSWAFLQECDSPSEVIEYFKTKLPPAAGTGALSTAGSASEDVQITLFYGASKHRITVSSFSELCLKIHDVFPSLATMPYTVVYVASTAGACKKAESPDVGQASLVVKDDDSLMRMLGLQKPDGWALRVLCGIPGFSSVKASSLPAVCRELLDCKIPTQIPGDVLFPPLQLSKEEENLHQLEELVHVAVGSILVWDEVKPRDPQLLEAYRRGYINPIIAASTALALRYHGAQGALQLLTEMYLAGQGGQGPIDYALLYYALLILIIEAKQDVAEGRAQALAQLASGRDCMCARMLDATGQIPHNLKRKFFKSYELAPALKQLASYAVVSSADMWVFYAYLPPLAPEQQQFKRRRPSSRSSSSSQAQEPPPPTPLVVYHDEPLRQSDSKELLTDNVRRIVLRISKLIVQQMCCVDGMMKSGILELEPDVLRTLPGLVTASQHAEEQQAEEVLLLLQGMVEGESQLP